MSSIGQKVTNDPKANQKIDEAVGVVTSDSLAAESMNNHGSFGAGNHKAAASKQPSASTTTNTTDTSGATKLNPAVDAEAREAQEGWSESAQMKAGAGLGKPTGIGPTYNIQKPHTDDAPTGAYAGGAVDQATQKPKGKNITEGGFDSDAPNASFNGEIGGKKDPGRVAEAQFQKSNAQSGGDVAGGPKQSGLSGGSPYEALKREEGA